VGSTVPLARPFGPDRWPLRIATNVT